MSRRRELQFKQLCELANLIEQARDSGQLDRVAACLNLLRASCELNRFTGKLDPHELEALADYTPDPAEAVAFYREAIVLNERRQEPTYTKRIWMAARLMELGEHGEARRELIAGRAEADRLRGEGAVAYADELLAKLAV